MIQLNKQKIADAFTVRRFPTGADLSKSGELLLIKEGECKIVSDKMPVFSRKIVQGLLPGG